MNPQPADYKSAALPVELRQHAWVAIVTTQETPSTLVDELILSDLTWYALSRIIGVLGTVKQLCAYTLSLERSDMHGVILRECVDTLGAPPTSW